MSRKAVCRAAAYLLMAMLCLFPAFFCHAAESGEDAFSAEEERPTVTSVSVSPGTAVVSKNGTCAFTASVTGENNYSREVAWSVFGQTSPNTFIDGNGILNVASDETASSMIVKAVSRQDSTYSATALVTVQASICYIQLQASPDYGGSVFGSGSVREGGYAVISASPNDGFTFEGWFLDDNKVSADARYVVDNIHGDATYVAEFKQVDCHVTVHVNDSNAGTATENKTVKYGESITLEASPRDGYQFDGWTENGNTVSRDSKMQVNRITGDRTFTAVFKKREAKSYTVNAYVGAGSGTITPQGKTTVTEGSGVLYTITPGEGYAIRTVYVDGKEIGKTSSFHFTDVRGDHTISVDFEKAPAKADTGMEKKPEQAEVKDDPEKPANEKPEGSEKEKEEESNREEPEENGAKEEEPELTGTLAELGISENEARKLIEENRDEELLAGAQNTGDLQLTVRNDFMDEENQNFGVPDFGKVPKQLLSKEEKLRMLQGGLPVSMELYIKDTEGKESEETKEAFDREKLPGMRIGRYFEISLSETKEKETKGVSTLPEKLRMTIGVPEHLKAENRKFYVLILQPDESAEQGLVQLTDEDESPDTITFSTDRLSRCAIAYMDLDMGNEKETEGITEEETDVAGEKNATNAVVAIAVMLAAGATLLLLWYGIAKKRSK